MQKYKSFYPMLLVMVAAFAAVNAQEAVLEYTSRDQIDQKYKWDLTPIYATDELWEADFAWVVGDVEVKAIRSQVTLDLF